MNHRVNKLVKFKHLGLIDYQQAWDYQTELFDKIISSKISNRKLVQIEQKYTENHLLFCEHPHVYTIGKSRDEQHLLLSQQTLQEKGIAYHKINRGGNITYHGPGQIVGYPILDLENFFTDIHKYLRLLEEAVILTLQDYGIDSGRIDGLTGVWIDYQQEVNPRKICALGVKSSRWVTMHGFAFNVNTRLEYFSNIVPCGISDKAVTSLEKELGTIQDMKTVENILQRHIANLFEMDLTE